MAALKKFIEWRKKEKHDVDTTNLLIGGIRSGMKGKVKKPRRGGRTPLDKSKPTLVEERRPMVQGSIQTTLDAIDHLDKAEEPFDIIYLFQTRAILCFGCGVKFNREKEQNELVVRHFCEREFTIHGVKKCKSQYAYFHFQVTCIKKKSVEL
ncbi:unnamed protein product [Mytilus coruscus]|uniref:Uncharacterized protein n=1 Tax=Mytilus coruscus TaxID=42192 RepID=A0A6J8EVF1_MYTCO|nr:unnamed protein product [Mytilus coruscus]